MSELIYVDTNVWIDFFLNRTDRLRPLGDFAFELFKKSLLCKYQIVISDWLRKEIEKTGFIENFLVLEKELLEKEKIIYIYVKKNHFLQAKKSKHWQDALHEILAIECKADFLVTRNVSDFIGKIPIVYPENL